MACPGIENHDGILMGTALSFMLLVWGGMGGRKLETRQVGK